MASALPPLPVNSSAKARMRSTRRAPSTTLAPCAERSRAVASPSPLLAPVMTMTFPSMLLPILFVADFLHPVDGLAVEPFLNGDVRHGGRWRGAVPMLLARRERDHVTRPNLLDRASPALGAAATCRHDQRLAQRVRVPCPPSARLERHARADDPCRIGGFEQRIDAYRAGEILRRTFAGRL